METANRISSSTIIEDVESHYKSDPTVAIVYYYFDFTNIEKQQYERLLRSLIIQLSLQSANPLEALDALFARCQDGKQQPTLEALASTFQYMLEDFQQAFIILDALDECEERKQLLVLLENLVGGNVENLHVLATSRREKAIENALTPLVTDWVSLSSGIIDADIQVYLTKRLQNHPRLKRWPANVRKEIEEALHNGAHGMYVMIALSTFNHHEKHY